MVIVSRLILIATLIWLLVSLYFMLKPEAQKYWHRRESQSDWKRLVLLYHGDQGRAQRLIKFEKKGNPGISDAEAFRRAIERFYRDNR